MAAHDSDFTLQVYLWLLGVILVILFFVVGCRTAMPDPGFSRRKGVPTPEFGGKNLLCGKIFAGKYIKMKEFGSRGGPHP